MKITVGPNTALGYNGHTLPEGVIVYLNERGQIHCNNGPAITFQNGELIWMCEGLLHRDGGPAIVRPGGFKAWFQHDKMHRDDGPAAIDGEHKEWYYHGNKVIQDDKIINMWNKEGVLEHQMFIVQVRPDLIPQMVEHFFLAPDVLRRVVELRPDLIDLVVSGNDITDPVAQEMILRQRPDLIGLMPKLVPELKAKYEHELKLAGVDV